MNNAPFIGVCGIRNAAEYARLVNISRDKLVCAGRFLMAGVKDIDDGLNAVKLSDDVRLFVHCDYNSSKAYSELVMDRLKESEGYARGLQLNIAPWMETDFTKLWKSLRQQYPHIALMLQVHQNIMERYTPEQIAYRLRQQEVDYVLFDASQSRGIPFDPIVMHHYVSAVYEQAPSMRVVVSGGLGIDTVDEILRPLATSFRELSCDAFHHLQNPFTKRLSWPVVEKYLTASQHALEI